jgi:DNA (cytosine-5)-methyltransferase 1
MFGAKNMKHGSLFSGIGGFDLAAEWAGWENVFNCEIDKFCKKVLKHYWPNAQQFEDITNADFTEWNGKIDVLSGGFPCQPYSAAGKRKGKDDARHLWPSMLRVIQQVRPRWVVGENVYGLVSWNGGAVFDEVCVDLENNGYAVWPVVFPACGVNAPHRRDRVWFVAYSEDSNANRLTEYANNWQPINTSERQKVWGEFGGNGSEKITTDSESVLLQRQCSGQRQGKFRRGNWDGFPTESPICSGDDGISYGLDGITFPKWRNESIKAYGNAIVPQVVYEIFNVINKFED